MLVGVKKEVSKCDVSDESSDDDISIKFHRKLEQRKRSLEAEINSNIVSKSRKKVCNSESPLKHRSIEIAQDESCCPKASKSKEKLPKLTIASRLGDNNLDKRLGDNNLDKRRNSITSQDENRPRSISNESISEYKNLRKTPVQDSTTMIRRFLYIPTDRYGEFIGKKGYNINSVKRYTGAIVDAKKCPETSEVYVEGFPSNVEKAVKIVNAFCESERSFDHPWLEKIKRTLDSAEEKTQQKNAIDDFTDGKKCPRTGKLIKIEYVPCERVPEFVGKKSCNLGIIEKKVGVKVLVPKLCASSRAKKMENREIQIVGDASGIKIVQQLLQYFRQLDRNVESRRPWARDALRSLNSSTSIVNPSKIIDTGINGTKPTSSPPVVNQITPRVSVHVPVVENDEVVFVRSDNKNSASIPITPPKEQIIHKNHSDSIRSDRRQKLGASTRSDLFDFLTGQHGSFKCTVQKFFDWLCSEDVTSIVDLAEAFEDEDFVQNEMKANGLKGYKSGSLRKACLSRILELERTKV